MDTKVKGAKVSRPTTTEGLQFYNLSHEWGFGMPQWPSAPLLITLLIGMLWVRSKDLRIV